MSNPNELVPELAEVARVLCKVTGNGSVPQATINLIGLRAGQIVGSTYLTIRATNELRKGGSPKSGSPRWRLGGTRPTSPTPSGPRWRWWRRCSSRRPQGSGELYAQAAEHFDAKALVTLSAAIGQVNQEARRGRVSQER